MNKEEIINNHPSLCYSCRYARKTASDENTEEGYVGCSIPVQSVEYDPFYSFVSIADEIAEGWVDLRSGVFGNKSGLITNCQLITKGVKKCSEYQKEYEHSIF